MHDLLPPRSDADAMAVASACSSADRATPPAVCASRGPEASYSDCATFQGAYRGAPLTKPVMNAEAQSVCVIHLAMAGNSDDPTRTGQAPGVFGSAPGEIVAFVNTWIAEPARTFTPRPDYGPQYNGVGECPF